MITYAAELIKYRSLMWALVVRHLSSRYRGSLLGFLWSFLNPLCLMLVYSLVFRYYIRYNDVEHYTIFLFCGLLPWMWTTSALSEGTSSIVSSGHLITKSMFPGHILPAVSVLTSLINFLLSLPLLFLFMFIANMDFPATLAFLPFVVLVQFVFMYGIVLALGSLNVHFRDVQHIIGNVLTLIFFLCPILYPASAVPEQFRFSIDLNPFAVFVRMYHEVILEGVFPPLQDIVYVSSWAMLAALVGTLIYGRYRESFAELL